jgi:hypothetical protein
MTMSEAVIIALVGGGSAVLGAVVGGAFMLSRNKAETTQIVTDTCLSLIEPLRTRIDELECELKDWMDCAEARAKQLLKVNITPAPFKSSKRK